MARHVELRTIAFLPRPVSLRIVVKRRAREEIRIDGRMVDADRMEVRVLETLGTPRSAGPAARSAAPRGRR
jgi:hypothetical protein